MKKLVLTLSTVLFLALAPVVSAYQWPLFSADGAGNPPGNTVLIETIVNAPYSGWYSYGQVGTASSSTGCYLLLKFAQNERFINISAGQTDFLYPIDVQANAGSRPVKVQTNCQSWHAEVGKPNFHSVG